MAICWTLKIPSKSSSITEHRLLNLCFASHFQASHMPRLLQFVSKVKAACTAVDPNSSIIWYDSVTIEGELKWQNQLNQLNELVSEEGFFSWLSRLIRPFFKACDGIFLNYTWKPEYLVQSKITAGQRDRDVYVGVDVFGRGCFGGGGFNTCEVGRFAIAVRVLLANVSWFALGHGCQPPTRTEHRSICSRLVVWNIECRRIHRKRSKVMRTFLRKSRWIIDV